MRGIFIPDWLVTLCTAIGAIVLGLWCAALPVLAVSAIVRSRKRGRRRAGAAQPKAAPIVPAAVPFPAPVMMPSMPPPPAPVPPVPLPYVQAFTVPSIPPPEPEDTSFAFTLEELRAQFLSQNPKPPKREAPVAPRAFSVPSIPLSEPEYTAAQWVVVEPSALTLEELQAQFLSQNPKPPKREALSLDDLTKLAPKAPIVRYTDPVPPPAEERPPYGAYRSRPPISYEALPEDPIAAEAYARQMAADRRLLERLQDPAQAAVCGDQPEDWNAAEAYARHLAKKQQRESIPRIPPRVLRPAEPPKSAPQPLEPKPKTTKPKKPKKQAAGDVYAFHDTEESLIWANYCLITGNSPNDTFRDKGLRGEYLAYKELYKLPGNPRFLFNMLVPKGDGDTTEIDVLMLHESGLYVIESKNYSGSIYGRDSQTYWTQVLSKQHKYRFYSPVKQNEGHIKWLKAFLNKPDLPYHSLVVFGNCNLKNLHIEKGLATVVKRDALYQTVQEIAARTGPRIPQDWLDGIYDSLYPHTQTTRAQRQAHVDRLSVGRGGASRSA